MYQENNYFTAFAEYKMAQNDNEEKETQVINLDQKSIGMSVIEEFLRNLQYQKKHKSEIVKTFTAFMKDKGKWRLGIHSYTSLDEANRRAAELNKVGIKTKIIPVDF